MGIVYEHSINYHSLPGPRAAFNVIFSQFKPQSILDVGCGTGTWLKAALEAGVSDVFGIDGIAVAPDKFFVPKKLFRQQNLTEIWDLGRRFEVILCLEVAEHLAEEFSENLIKSITNHADIVFFGAACPGQTGQHHLNCQWPAYWQGIFNRQGFCCFDEVRWQIWQDERIEPWYRQNIFMARRCPDKSGQEPRIPSVVHPDILKEMRESEYFSNADKIASGALPFSWYLNSFPKVLIKKLGRKFKF